MFLIVRVDRREAGDKTDAVRCVHFELRSTGQPGAAVPTWPQVLHRGGY